VSWFLTFVGFALLIILHEFGHFIAAKKVGMRVERFALFFPPLILKRRRGETEYGIGAIPLGGFVKITGMNPDEEIPEEVRSRAYYMQKPWKRIVVILAGPAVNLIIAFALLFGIYALSDVEEATNKIDKVTAGKPAAAKLKSGDEIIAVNGAKGSYNVIAKQLQKNKCVGGKKVSGCKAAKPTFVTVKRSGKQVTFPIYARYDKKADAMLLGFEFLTESKRLSPLGAVSQTASSIWLVTTLTVDRVTGIFNAEKRKDLGSVVGGYEATRRSVEYSPKQALFVLALISLSLAIINLFPFLPLDGGHIFWALVEKIRGKRVPVAVMERSGMIGFAIVIAFFLIGLNNDINRLESGAFDIR